MKNIRRNSFIILVVSAIFVVYILKDNFFETMRILRNANVFWLGLAVLLFFGHVTVEAFAMYKLTVKKEKKYPYKKIFKLFVMTKFFNGITPFATGGQPLQVYELKRDGIEVSKGTNIVVEHFILFQTSIMILGVISILLNRYFILFEYDPVVTNLFIVGFIINAIILIVVYISSISKNINKKFVLLINSLGHKMKIIKNKTENQKKLEVFFDHYFEGFSSLRKNKKFVIKLIILQITALCLLFLIPQTIFNALNMPHNLNIVKSIVAGTYVFIAGSFVPIPGGTGGVEFAFVKFYSNFVPRSLLPPALLAWRFLTYYTPVVVGAVIYNFFHIKKNEE